MPVSEGGIELEWDVGNAEARQTGSSTNLLLIHFRRAKKFSLYHTQAAIGSLHDGIGYSQSNSPNLMHHISIAEQLDKLVPRRRHCGALPGDNAECLIGGGELDR